MADVFLIEPGVQRYEWGALSGLQELLSLEPDGKPVAEAWWGTHPAAPATVDGVPLGEVIAGDPVAMLGEDVYARWGELPFLLKVLSISKPLSIQVHPTKEQARSIRSQVDAAHSPLTDLGHKPEMLVAVTPMRVQTGFRPLAETAADLRLLGVPLADALAERLDAGDLSGYLHAVLDGPTLVDILDALAAWGDGDTPATASASLCAAIAANRAHPRDNGALVSLSLNTVELQPGEACFTDAGVVHSYQSGFGIEVMATSDNVLRAGLTPKPLHVPLVLEVALLEAREVDRLDPAREAEATTYSAPAEEFELIFVRDGERAVPSGPVIILAFGGDAQVTSPRGRYTLSRGQAMFVPAAEADAVVTAQGEIVMAAVPRA